MRLREDDESSSINAEEQSDFSQIFETDQNIAGADFGGHTGGIDSEDSAAMIKKSKNREAAKISRQKKKVEFEQFQARYDKIVKENNKLKLDNAALRAENSIIKRQLNYFENLFAKKNAYEANTQQTGSTTQSQANSLGSRSNHSKYNDSEAGNPLDQTTSEVSFVLERNQTGTSPARRMGLSSLALVMCICCCSQLFDSSSSGASSSRRLAQGAAGSSAPATHLIDATAIAVTEGLKQATPMPQASASFIVEYFLTWQDIVAQQWTYILIIVSLSSLICAVALFPTEAFI